MRARSFRDALAVGVIRFCVRAAVIVVLVSVAQWSGHPLWHQPPHTFRSTVVASTP